MIIPKRRTHKQQVLWYIGHHGSITSLEAIRAFTITRLASVIHLLANDDNVDFKRVKEVSSETGKSYTRYSFKEAK
jgi:hypothetical protein